MLRNVTKTHQAVTPGPTQAGASAPSGVGRAEANPVIDLRAAVEARTLVDERHWSLFVQSFRL